MNTSTLTPFKLLTLGYSVIPSGGGDKGKSPKVNWTEYQSRCPTDAELEIWENENPPLWGIVTGKISGVVIIDVDEPEKYKIFETQNIKPHVKTPRGGFHYWFKHPGYHVKTKAGLLPGLDIRGDGGFVNVLGTNPKTGKSYEILIVPAPETVYPWDKLPAPILKLIKEQDKKEIPADSQIPQGENDQWLTSRAGSYRRAGDNEAQIVEKLKVDVLRLDQNPAQPYTEKDLQRIAHSMSRYEPATPSGNGHTPEYDSNDTGNAERMARMYGQDIRFVFEYNQFIIWNGKYWEIDQSGNKVMAITKKVAQSYYLDTAKCDDDKEADKIVKHAKLSKSQTRRQAMLELFKAEPNITTFIKDIDTDIYYLNCKNGTVDLRTGELKPHDHADMITKFINIEYDPDAQSFAWYDFLSSTFDNNDDMAEFMRLALGMSATGDISNMAAFFPYGRGWNGKSTLLESIMNVLGEDYAAEVDPAAFMENDKNRGAGPDENIAALYKKRFVCSTEIAEGHKLSSALIKRATGGETLFHERKYQHRFEYHPIFKLWLSGNCRATVKETTDAIWLRLKQIPFNRDFRPNTPGFNANLKNELKSPENLKAILAWLVTGARDWYQGGKLLTEPKAVKEATQSYRQDQDTLHDFINECCDLTDPAAETLAKDLYKKYTDWAKENQEIYPLGKRNFYEKLRDRNLVDREGNQNRKVFSSVKVRKLEN